MSDNDSFSLDEIRSQLASLGYDGISDDRLHQFQTDLSKLMSVRSEDESWTASSSKATENVNLIELPTEEESSFMERTDITEYNDLPAAFKDNEPSDTETDEPPAKSNYHVPSNRMKRKILRKQDGQSFVSIESSMSRADSIVSIEPHRDADTESLCSFSTIDSDLRVRLNRLKINIGKIPPKQENRVRFEPDLNYEVENIPPPPRVEKQQRPSTAPADWRFWDGERGSLAPAFLKPQLKLAHKRGPVELYHRYKEDWDRFSYPSGAHIRERLEIRKICATRDAEPVKPRRRVTTDYIVPTTKKRQALSWEVRTALHERRPIQSATKNY